MKHFTLWKSFLLLCALVVGSNAWADTVTYTFNSKSWGAKIGSTAANWTCGAEGNQFTSGQGIQVTTGKTGANGTSPSSYTNISKIEIQYCTNASSGVGSINVQVGTGTEKSFSVTKPSSGGTTLKTATFNYSPSESGNVKITVNCTSNSVYVYSATITYTSTVAITGITMNATANVGVGGTVTLTPSITPNNATETVAWESNDETVATVAAGVVMGVKAGTAVITAKSPSDATIKAECTVTVTAAVEVTGVTLDKTSTTMEVGDEETLTATVSPNDATNKNVTWESSDEDVATVEDGVVTAVGVGTATITVKSVADNTKTATCTVTVNPTAVSSVALNKTSATVKVGKTLTLTPTISPVNATNKNVTWESSNTSVATVSDAGVVTGVAAGSATITVKTEDGNKTATCEVTVITAGDGSKTKPYDVDEALELISGYGKNTGSNGSVYTKGIVSQVGNMYSTTMLNYYISIDGTTTNQIQVFRGKNLGNTSFSATTDLSVGDEVIIYGQLYKYGNNNNEVAEINTGNYLYSLNGVKVPEITFGAASYEVAYNGSLTITATADCSGAITFESDDETIAEINATTGVVTPHKAGEVTITANIAASTDNIAGSKDVTLTVTDGRAAAGIAFAEATVTKTWGEAFTGQALTNENDLTVTYESSVPAVATVNETTGAVTVLKAGTTVITATFDGNEDYMPAEVSYTLTVNKAAAGLSFDETEFDVDLNSDDFVAPTLNNPNSLTVTYASNDENIAIVDENTGDLLLITEAEGEVTITASFAGNDNFLAGNASYTITITDPNKKGTKRNPYTVAEVLDGTATGTVYVQGYIVGFVTGTSSFSTTPGSNQNSNWALADDDSEETFANVIPVEIKSGTQQPTYGIGTHSDLLKAKAVIKGEVQSYFSKNGVKGIMEFNVSRAVTVSAAGYATVCATNALDFTDVEGLTAYTASMSENTVNFTEVAGDVPSTGLLLKANAGTYYVPVVGSSETDVTENVLRGVTSNKVIDGTSAEKAYYVLQKKGENVGFYRVTNNAYTVRANSAYLEVPITAAKDFIGFDDGETTGIESIHNSQFTIHTDAPMYNMSGQRVSESYKGIVIVNGRKVVRK
jgi:uncharacterized protein YjdB